MPSGAQPRVAIVSDPLVQRGGAERVVEAFARAFPEAPIFAILYSASSGPRSISNRVVPSWLQRIPGAEKKHRAFFPLFPAAIESFDLHEYDIILSSHHTAAKGLLRRAGQRHICYCHTPMRAVWERPFEELETLPKIAQPGVGALFAAYRVWDYVTAARVDQFVANSRITQRRIAQHYGRDSVVLNPPIDVQTFQPAIDADCAIGQYYLVASRSVPYKRIDVAIAAAKAANRRVVVVGGEAKSADGSVEYRGHVSDSELVSLMQNARALLFPQEEDFGMAPLEMNACGRPVIAYGAGGALETVIHGETGIHVAEQTASAFAEAIQAFEGLTFDAARLRRHAEEFSQERFIKRIRSLILDA